MATWACLLLFTGGWVVDPATGALPQTAAAVASESAAAPLLGREVARLTAELRLLESQLAELAHRRLQKDAAPTWPTEGADSTPAGSMPAPSATMAPMESVQMDMEMLGMRSTLYLFDASEPLVLLVSGWSVETWAGYLLTLVALFAWSLLHERLGELRIEVSAAVGSRSRRSKEPGQDSTVLGEPLTAMGSSGVGVVALTIGGMTCDACSERIQAALRQMDGVESAEVSFDTRTATVVGIVAEAALIERVSELGYEASAGGPTAGVVCFAPCGVKAAPATAAHSAATDAPLAARIARRGAWGAVAVSAMQLLSSTLLMLAAMSFELGVVSMIVLGRAVGLHLAVQGKARAAAAEPLDCCT